MKEPQKPPKRSRRPDTDLVELGRNPAQQYGFVNTPVYRGSTVLFPTMKSLEALDQQYFYGRRGTPTQQALQDAVCALEGGSLTLLTPSGLSAITASLLAFAKAGSHVLVADSVYGPTRRFCDNVLTQFGVETTYYDPLIGGDIAQLMRAETTAVFTESPGSLTFEVQDLPAIGEAAHAKGAVVILDNTWATPLYFKPFSHGVDVSIQSATKYIGGHADALLGTITAVGAAAERVHACHGDLGLCPGSEDVFLSLRGLRTLGARLERHARSALELAHWLKGREEVAEIIYPALEGDSGHAIWSRDFSGAPGLFSIILKPVPKKALAAMLDGLEIFGMGYSWGGYESLVLPFDAAPVRSATTWKTAGPALRLHIGLEDVQDMQQDLHLGFERMTASS
jgi:cystathionine beta-lyase